MTKSYIEQLVLKLYTQKVLLWVENGSLRYKAPKGALTPALREEIVAHKAELLALLEQSSTNALSPPIQPITREGQLPLSFAQQRLWFLNQFEGSNSTYNIPIAWELSGFLNRSALAQSLTEIVRRHESLRTNLVAVEGHPVQVIHPPQEVTISVIDLQTLPEAEKRSSVQRLALQEAEYRFNLADGVLLRVALLQLAETAHVLMLTMHHIISDGWSLGVLIEELSVLYNAFIKVQPSPLPPLPIQYVDFAHWQRNQRTMLDNQLVYWKKQLTGAPPLLQLPTDHPRLPVQSFRGAQYKFELPSTLNKGLRFLSRETESTLFMLLYTAFAILLYRYSGQEDILVGTPIANRHRRELEPLIGFFVNTLVLRADLSDNPTFRALLAQVRQTTLEAYNHQDLPFELLVETLKPERNLSHSPLVQVVFSLQSTSKYHLNLPELMVTPLEVARSVSKFELSLLMEEGEQGITGEFEYDVDLFETDTIERMTMHFQTLLAGIIANPDHPIGTLPLLTEAEQHQLLVEWNDTLSQYPVDKCIHQLFEEQVEHTPDAIAVVYEDQQLTYSELNDRANQLAHYLRTIGVELEVLVGICVDRSLEMIVGLLGILKAGGTYVPLDPTYPSERLAFMLADARVRVLLTQQRLVEGLAEHQAVVVLDTDWNVIAQQSKENPASGVKPENLIYMIYTSGSTGKPKGAMNTHAGIKNRLLWMQDAYQFTAADRFLQKTPFSFDVSVWELFCPLIAGARLVVARPGGHQDSNYLVNLIAQQQITTVHFVPSMLQVFLQEQGLEACSCLRQVMCSGEALPFELQERFFASLDAQLHNLYGPTEASIDVTFWACRSQSNQRIVPIGRPIANTQIYILDSNLQPVPIGIPGELHIGGVGVARGYLNRPELTAEKFIPNPFTNDPHVRMYKTGDLVCYLSDGNIKYLGRIDNQVKIRGFRIELGEIENLLSQHTAIREVVVVVREEVTGPQIVAYFVASPISSHDLRVYLTEKLPDYMIPSAFVKLDSLPLNPNGKVDQRALPKPTVRSQLEATYMMPQTDIERQITAVWQDVLKVEHIGIHDNFFELGGHSLLIVQVHNSLQEIFKQKLAVTELFKYSTVYSLAKHLSELKNEAQESQPALIPQDRVERRKATQANVSQRKQLRQKSRNDL
ncbi:amino acid adenylation domain-containing protein [Plectonema radiosum NIES-515]|uniref:Amino acid adenylation domain-containing protein n=1 Tax=Plectonema radiosum NIES-515 TaxID=2986073 RepID=A0ABT3B6I4_9CYAN|nr:amino acid adenylation domain-containing protein [Plectonema radiosum]MCV3216971.1 amino acid adenylation domain-containing protein [Plectonema radiosum NIES-515]